MAVWPFKIFFKMLRNVIIIVCSVVALLLSISLIEQKIGTKVPILVWWTALFHVNKMINCGELKCIVTSDRGLHPQHQLKVFLFYGTFFDIGDLPLPRKHVWALFHEESPKNNRFLFSHDSVLNMFNYTSTFGRHSGFPITLFHLDSLEKIKSKTHLKSVSYKNELLKQGRTSLISYVHSDCSPPSDRDHLVQMIQKHIKIDSLGKCLHNKDLPESLSDPKTGASSEEFYEILSGYKFALAIENSLCEDYITEKFWRPLQLGTVPIVFKSSKVQDWMPSNKSAIFIDDFSTVKELVDYILFLNSNDSEYEQYLQHKDLITNENLVESVKNRAWSRDGSGQTDIFESFECFVCRSIHEKRSQNLSRRADQSHYKCPRPQVFADVPPGNLTLVSSKSFWGEEFDSSEWVAKVFQESLEKQKLISKDEIELMARNLRFEKRSDLN